MTRQSSRASKHFGMMESLEQRQLFATLIGVDQKSILAIDTVSGDQLQKIPIRGTLPKEVITAIDFQPNTGRLYGLGSTNRVYRINPTTGVATNAVSTGDPLTPAVAGTSFGLDINDVNEIRVMRGGDVHAVYGLDAGGGVINTTTKTVPSYLTGDANFGQTPNIVGIAHTYTEGQPNLTTLYGIDAALGNLVQIGSTGGSPDSPDTGLLATIGSLGQTTTSSPISFDILGSGEAFLGLSSGPKARTNLFSVNLSTGATTAIGEIGKAKRPLADFAILPIGTPILTTDNKFFKVADSSLPSLPFFTGPKISGLQKKEKILILSRRPSDDVVFAYTNQYRLYTANVNTGVMTALGQTDGLPLVKVKQMAGDIDPVEGTMRIGIFSDNFRINLSDGSLVDSDPLTDGVQLDTDLNYPTGDPNAGQSPFLGGISYTQAIPGATFTAPFGVDQVLNILTTISSPNGQEATTANLFTQGTIDPFIKSVIGFDISTASDLTTNTAFLAYKGTGGNFLTTVDLNNNAATTDPLKFGKGWNPVAMAALD